MKKHKLPTWSLSGNIKWDHSKCLKSYTAVKGNPSNLNSEYCDLCCDSISWCGADRSIRYSKHALSCTQSYECTLVLYIYFVWSVHVAVISAHTDNWNTFGTFLHTEQEEKAAGSHDLMIATACANLLCVSDAMQSRCQIFCYWKSQQESHNVRMLTGRLKRKRIGLSWFSSNYI